MPHPIDRLLFDGLAVPAEVLSRELAKPLPKAGDSYWADAVRDLLGLVAAGDLAPSNLGTQAIVLARSIIEEARSPYEAASSP